MPQLASSSAHIRAVPTDLVATPRLTAVVGCTSPLVAVGVADATSRGGISCYAVQPDPVALVAAVARQRPDLCLVVAPFVRDLADLVSRLTESSRSTRVVVLAYDETPPPEVLAVLQAGAQGWLPLHTDGRGLVDALRGVVRGEAALPRMLVTTLLAELRATGTRRVVRADGTTCELPPREHDVLLGLAEGLSTAEVAVRLGIGDATARGYVASAVRRLRATNRVAAVALVRAENQVLTGRVRSA